MRASLSGRSLSLFADLGDRVKACQIKKYQAYWSTDSQLMSQLKQPFRGTLVSLHFRKRF